MKMSSKKKRKRIETILVGMGLSDKTVSSYGRVYRALSERFKSGISETSIVEFLGDVKESTSESMYYLYYYALKKLAKIAKVPFDVKPPEKPEPRHRPVVSMEQLQTMIDWAKENGSKAAKFYLALSSVFGFRRVELCSLTEENFVNNYIVVKPKKRGRTRQHRIPPEIEDMVYGFRPSGMNEATMSRFFRSLAKKAGVSLPRRAGWHSIRRLLVTSLFESGVDPMLISKFMGWSLVRPAVAFISPMVEIYTRIESDRVDEEIYAQHPILPMWREK